MQVKHTQFHGFLRFLKHYAQGSFLQVSQLARPFQPPSHVSVFQVLPC